MIMYDNVCLYKLPNESVLTILEVFWRIICQE